MPKNCLQEIGCKWSGFKFHPSVLYWLCSLSLQVFRSCLVGKLFGYTLYRFNERPEQTHCNLSQQDFSQSYKRLTRRRKWLGLIDEGGPDEQKSGVVDRP